MESDKTWTEHINPYLLRSSLDKIWNWSTMKPGSRPTKKSKNGKIPNYVSILENNQIPIDWNQYASMQLKKKVIFFLIGSFRDLSLSKICQTSTKTTLKTKK